MTEKGLKKRSRGIYMKILIAFCVILFLSFYVVHRIIQSPYDYQARKQARIEELDKTHTTIGDRFQRSKNISNSFLSKNILSFFSDNFD